MGAGTGRFALRLAPKTQFVIAVDEYAENVLALERDAGTLGLTNIRTILGRWSDVYIDPVDVAFSSYVLPLVEDATQFLTKLSASAFGDAFVYMSAFTVDAIADPLWRHFHGTSRCFGPTYLDAACVLSEIGISAEIEVVEVPDRTRFATLAEATGEFGEYFLLPNTPEVVRELEGLLANWLISSKAGLRPPLRVAPAAVIRWKGRGGSSV